MKNNLNLVLIILIFIVLACNCPKPDEQTNTKPVVNSAPTAPVTASSSPAGNKSANVNAQPTKEAASITWNDYDRIYNTKSNSTDMQKDALWNKFENKTVTWTGTVHEVSEGMLGGLSIKIKMNADTLTNDIDLQLKEGQKEKAMELTKGKKITFTGRLRSYGGAILPVSMDEGEFK